MFRVRSHITMGSLQVLQYVRWKQGLPSYSTRRVISCCHSISHYRHKIMIDVHNSSKNYWELGIGGWGSRCKKYHQTDITQEIRLQGAILSWHYRSKLGSCKWPLYYLEATHQPSNHFNTDQLVLFHFWGWKCDTIYAHDSS